MLLLAHFIEVFVRFRAVKLLPFIHISTCTHSVFIIYLSAAELGLHCCTGALSNCGEQGCLPAAHCGGCSCCRVQALGACLQSL